jgi:hypothetical protein
MIKKNSSFSLNLIFICLSVLLLTRFHFALAGILSENLLWRERRRKIFSIQNFLRRGLPLPQRFLSTLLLDFHNILVIRILAGIITSVSLLTIRIFFIQETNKVLNQNIKIEVL